MGRVYESARRDAQGQPPEPFTLDGVKFSPRGDVHLLDLAELARHADEDVDSPAGLAALADFYEGLLGAAEYRRFRTHTREHATEPELLSEIMFDIVKDVTGRPKSKSTRSASGQSSTGTTSRAAPRGAGRRRGPDRVQELAAAQGNVELILVPPPEELPPELTPEDRHWVDKHMEMAGQPSNRATRRARQRAKQRQQRRQAS